MIARLLVAAAVAGGAGLGALAYRRREPDQAHVGRRLAGRSDVPEGPAVLVFTSSLCRACRRSPELIAEALDVTEADLPAGEASVRLAERDVGEHADLAAELDVTRTPTLVGVDGGGVVSFVHEGNPEPERLAGDLAGLEGER